MQPKLCLCTSIHCQLDDFREIAGVLSAGVPSVISRIRIRARMRSAKTSLVHRACEKPNMKTTAYLEKNLCCATSLIRSRSSLRSQAEGGKHCNKMCVFALPARRKSFVIHERRSRCFRLMASDSSLSCSSEGRSPVTAILCITSPSTSFRST